ncbi:uncharacterized protein LOC115233164 [Formica exsecta]|uniref:uncharacterized protein LOC115233164 n=1 Tax=Formica exsecta TaxID=72781 RepID=UPI0011418390|nr:uncharacterized protein LOC115233164 [Formica exsecta]
MSQQGRGRGRDTEKTNKLTSKALQLLSTDIAKYRTSHSQQLQRRDVKNIQGHTTRNMTVTTTTQRQTAPLQYSQSPVSSSLHASSSSFSRAQSYEHMPSPSVQHRNISSRSSSSVAQSFVRNIPLTSKSSPQHKQTSSLSSSAAQSLARNILPLSKSSSQLKQTSSRSLSPAIKSFTQNIHPPSKPLSQYKQTLLRPSPSPSSSTVQRNLRLLPVRENSQEHKEEGTPDERISHDIVRSLKMIMTQLRRMEERQISIEKKTDENTTAIKRLMRESAVKRPIKPQGISFRTVDDFLAFEEVDEEIYNDLVGYFIYLGRTNPVDCAAEYFRSIFPEDEEISSCLTLNGRTGPGGCKLRDSRFAQACQGS